ncbi:MAG: GntR family transcriptional regulator [Hyphomicrobiaceae bacterium]
MLDPLRSEPALIDQVRDTLVEAISVGRLLPGERLTQERVASLLDVSRQPVSHALQLLKHHGLVVEHGRRGVVVAPLDGTRILHLYEVRMALDGLAARLASHRVANGSATADEIAAVRRALDAGTALDASADTIDLVRADVAFHRGLYELSGNPEIARTVAEQWPQFMRSMAAVLDTGERKPRIWQEHAAILDAVLAGDGETAERLAGDHALRAGEAAKRRIDGLATKQEM